MKNKMERTMQSAVSVQDAKYDILKFILSFFVVAIHTALYPMVLYPWLRMAVPLFFIITGYFLSRKMCGITEIAIRKKIIKKFVLRNLKLYFFWLVCLFPLVVYYRRDILFVNGIAMSVFALLKMILFGSTFTGSWYIMSSITAALIIFLLLQKVPTKIMVAFSLVLYVLIAVSSSYPGLIERSNTLSVLYNGYSSMIGTPTLTFPVAIVWFVCGKCFAEENFPLRKSTYIAVTVVSALLLYAEWNWVQSINGTYKNDCYLFLLPFCYGLFGWIHSMEPVTIPCALQLKRCSTVIFTAHGAVRTLLGMFYRHVMHLDSPVLLFITASAVCIVIYLTIEVLLKRYSSGIFRLLKYAY